MRMWAVNPKLLCQKHLCGEHVEMHMFAGTLSKGKSIQGYLDKNLVNPSQIKSRHDELAKEMERRKYNHTSPLDLDCCNLVNSPISIPHNRAELIKRCPECAKRIKRG